ncbi:adenylate kinase [Herbivorax sp. ANBcel31]|uniref:adenylate kinase n=1 Tax=Herbivorax sp. ANBcel31 TaxID=3069754 RepID=UPI0027B2C920|nr:adenylate kinase [Herbivorax sp. ANBcel31]MDQ2087602.1 adenylate kinase [Herbivorax sp. ANBcel31]
MRLIILGAPGAGKGTQAVNLSKKYNVPHISTGDIFRSNIKNGTELGKKAKEYIDKGLLVPDDVTIGIVEDRLTQSDCKDGFILDGFPRTIEQAEKLDAILEGMKVKLDKVLNIHVPDSQIVKRMSGRRVCPKCGISYHTKYKPTTTEGVCDSCKSDVIQREDDKEETVKQRLETYHKQTEPLIEYYTKKGSLVTVTGQEKIEDTTNEVIKALGEG